MVNATIDVLSRGVLETDLNYFIEGNTLGSHDEPNPDTDYVEIPVYQSENYTNETPLGAGLLWSQRHWYRSLTLLKEFEHRYNAMIVYGHNSDQFEEIKGEWR